MKKKKLLLLLFILLLLHCSKSKDNEIADLQKGLKAWFKLDGGFTDSAGNAIAIDHSGSVSAVADRKGNKGSAMSFDDGYFWFDFPESFAGFPISISLWIKPKDLKKQAYLLQAGTHAFGIHQIDNRIGFTVSTPVTDGFTSAFTAQWSHITGTFDGNSVKLYINGKLIGEEINPGIPDATMQVKIGSLPDDPTKWEGALDEIRFYNRLLSSEEIKMLAEQ